MEVSPDTLLDAFEINPAVVALLIVIYLLYKLVRSRDATIADLIKGDQADIRRQTKMLTLLEILVKRKANFRTGEDGRGSD